MSEELRMVAAGGAAVLPLPRRRAEPARPEIAEEQLAYARLLGHGVKAGLAVLTATFLAYVGGVVPPRIPVTELPRYWALPVKQYLAATGVAPGWSWLRLLDHGDFLNFVGIAFLSGVTIACYLAITPILFRKKDRIYGWLAIVEVLVLALAASGLLNVGAH